ncbi:MAG: hypothetical protein B6I20_14430 [Bacteroidetes bacterium 4572_117]|nr:MAG: hypothetical protein B6I20_14430 [Bacteroidetes bacterium 4572_117]
MIYSKTISPKELKQKIDNGEDIFIVDANIHINMLKPIDSAKKISPTDILTDNFSIPKDKPVIIYCLRGVDSFLLMNMLLSEYAYTDVYSLKSGLEGWHKFIEETKH